jgi:hypothetical protein
VVGLAQQQLPLFFVTCTRVTIGTFAEVAVVAPVIVLVAWGWITPSFVICTTTFPAVVAFAVILKAISYTPHLFNCIDETPDRLTVSPFTRAVELNGIIPLVSSVWFNEYASNILFSFQI